MASRAEKLEGLCEDLCDALAWILPLAKGYAAEHQVGSNSGLCIEAEDTLRKARAALALPADAPKGLFEAVAWVGDADAVCAWAQRLLACVREGVTVTERMADDAQGLIARLNTVRKGLGAHPTPRAEAASAVPAWRDSFPPTHYCRECKALWRRWPDGSWSLVTAACGKCCDNVPMGEQIVALGDPCAAPASAEAAFASDDCPASDAALGSVWVDRDGAAWRKVATAPDASGAVKHEAPASAEAVAREAADLLAEMDAAWPPSQPPPHPKSFQGRFQARVRAVANALRACKAGGA